MTNVDTHIWLYAKHHYVKTDIMDDLTTIFVHRNALTLEHYSEGELEHIIVGQLMYMCNDHLSKVERLDLMYDLYNSDDKIASVGKMLMKMSVVRAKDLNLGDADETILKINV